MKINSIAAVVVTYNRANLLKECINGLLNQTLPLNAIYIIDNNSTDATPEIIAGMISQHGSKLKYIRLKENTGGSGGFNEGIRIARDDGHEWLWLMDDDVEPYKSGLENLIKYRKYGLCIHGQRTTPKNNILTWGGNFDPDYVRVHKTSTSFNENNYIEVSVGCFEGMLIHQSIVNKINLPDKEYFITWDDTIYGYEASKHTKVLYVKELSLKRKKEIENTPTHAGRRIILLSSLAAYHQQKNRFIYAKKNSKLRLKFVLGTIIEMYMITAKSVLAKNNGLNYFKHSLKGLNFGLKYIFLHK